MAVSAQGTIFKNLWRFLEILLFFIISVVGYSILAKTSVSAKSKSRDQVSRMNCVEQFCAEPLETFFLPFEHSGAWIHHLTSNTAFDTPHALCDCPPLHLSLVTDSPAPQTIPHYLPAPYNLFQHNPVLLN